MEPIKTLRFVMIVMFYVRLVTDHLIITVSLVKPHISIMTNNVKQLVHKDIMQIQPPTLVSHVIPAVTHVLDQTPLIVILVLMDYI